MKSIAKISNFAYKYIGIIIIVLYIISFCFFEQIPFCFKVEVRESEGNTVIYEKD